MGSASLLLVMTGHERDAAVGLGIGALLNIVLSLILIPQWGLEGAAVATTISMVAWNLLLVAFVFKRLQIHTTIFGTISLWRRA
jgi:O-antigen/teichoic acid export membrane protein